MVTVTGTLQSSANESAVAGSVQVMLCGYGSQVPRANGLALVARIKDQSIASTGSFSFQVHPNDVITPAGTYYTVEVKDENGDTAQINAYQFLSNPATYDLNTLDPYDPTQTSLASLPPMPPADLAVSGMASGGAVTVTGTLESSVNGTAVAGTVQVMLCGYGSRVPRVNGVALVARIKEQNIAVAGNGTFMFTVFPNDEIAPAATYYTVQISDDNGDTAQINAYRFLSVPSTYDLNLIDPYDPIQPPPPLPPILTNLLQIVPPADDMAFDGSIYSAFKTTLTGDVARPGIENMEPGNLYTFIVVQDATGGHSLLPWPPLGMHNATAIDLDPNSTTIQTFVADEARNLWAIGPATYYP